MEEAIKRNSTEFKDVEKLVRDYEKKPSRKKLIRLYALRPTESLDEKVLVNNRKSDGDVLYDLNYSSILEHFSDRSHKLYRAGRKPLYYFKTSAKSSWCKLPFEFTGKLKTQLFPLKVVR
jgi:hypothetical protein